MLNRKLCLLIFCQLYCNFCDLSKRKCVILRCNCLRTLNNICTYTYLMQAHRKPKKIGMSDVHVSTSI